MLDIEPIEIFIEKEGLKLYLRNKSHKQIQWDGLSRTETGISSIKGHLKIWERKVQEAGLLDWPLDIMVSRLTTTKNYDIDLDSFSSGEMINDDSTYRS